jgi:hypothetical protein
MMSPSIQVTCGKSSASGFSPGLLAAMDQTGAAQWNLDTPGMTMLLQLEDPAMLVTPSFKPWGVPTSGSAPRMQ